MIPFHNILCYCVATAVLAATTEAQPPNIIHIMGDDMGWNDVSLHGSNQIPTPNIDALACNGMALSKQYTMHICSPSRTAFVTGNNPIRAGMQGYPLTPGELRSMPISMPTMAEHLKSLGYKTYMVGKWHLGFHNRTVCPVGRGFDSHIGYWSGYVGYFDYQIDNLLQYNGFDLHRNYKPAYEHAGSYATEVFTQEAVNIIEQHAAEEPLFLAINHLAAHTGKGGTELGVPNPDQTRAQYSYITGERQLYAGVVNYLDDSVGQVVEALAKKNLLENSIIIFQSDNGAPTKGTYANTGSNWPFRGQKQTLYEGGVRNTAVMWSPLLLKKQYVDNTVFHITDWLPTLYAAAGGDVSNLGKIDGVNQWPRLSLGQLPATPRRDILLNIDERTGHKALLSHDGLYKLVTGADLGGLYDGYYGDSGRNGNEPPYSTDAVLASAVNTAIASLSTTSPALTAAQILSIRSQLEVKQANNPRGPMNCIARYCLFDLLADPTETKDVSLQHLSVVGSLVTSLGKYMSELVLQTNTVLPDPRSNPTQCNNTWFPWLDPVLKCDL